MEIPTKLHAKKYFKKWKRIFMKPIKAKKNSSQNSLESKNKYIHTNRAKIHGNFTKITFKKIYKKLFTMILGKP